MQYQYIWLLIHTLILAGGKLKGRWVRKPPADDGSVRTGADEGFVVGADLNAGDTATMGCPYVAYHTIHVVPYFHQFVITTWETEKWQIL